VASNDRTGRWNHWSNWNQIWIVWLPNLLSVAWWGLFQKIYGTR
jgi:hypothetical protein